MAKSSSRRNVFTWNALQGWSWPERILVLVLGGAAVLALAWNGVDWAIDLPPLAFGWFDAVWIAGTLAAVAFLALNIVVFRHGGWHLLGPHFYYDVVRLARRGRSTAVRVVYIIALFIGLAVVFESTGVAAGWRPNDFAQVSEKFTFALFLIQNIAIMVLTPAYLGSAIAEEKERHTLELLFTTQLNNQEIVLGKLTARLIHLFGFVLAGFPVLCLVQFWGGIDMLLILGNLVNTLLNILSIGSVCLLFSALARTVTGAVMMSYLMILPFGMCCGGVLRGFPFVLQDARVAGAGNITVQHLGILCVVHLVIVVGFLSLTIAALRETEPLSAVLPPSTARLDVDYGSPRVGMPTAVQAKPILKAPMAASEPILHPPKRREPEPENEFSIPYTLPPMTDQALIWKERYVGGPPWFFSPMVLVPALPFLVTGFLVMLFWFVRSLFLSQEEFRRAVEAWAIVLRVLYYLGLTFYTLGVGFRAASCVARERQQQTLDPLLLMPIDRGEILWAKLLGSFWRGWPWLTLLLANIVLGTIIGAYHPFSAVLLCLAPWALVLFIAGLGLLLSVQMQTVLRANMVMLLVVIFLIAATLLWPRDLTPPLGYLEPLAFPMWGEVWGERGVYVVSACIILLVYGVCAAAFLRTAFWLFERRNS